MKTVLRTNSCKEKFQEKIKNFKSHLLDRGYPENLIQTTLSQVNDFEDRKLALQPTKKENKRIFVTQYQPSVPNLKQILMEHWHLIEQQPLLREIYKDLPLISYKRGRSLNDILVRWRKGLKHALGSHAGLSTPFYTNEKNVFMQFQRNKIFSQMSAVRTGVSAYIDATPLAVFPFSQVPFNKYLFPALTFQDSRQNYGKPQLLGKSHRRPHPLSHHISLHFIWLQNYFFPDISI